MIAAVPVTVDSLESGATLARAMPEPLDAVRSSVAGVAWPGLPSAAGARLLALQFQLEQTQWWPPERLREHQYRQLGRLLEHARAHVPYYRERLSAGGYRPGAVVDDDVYATLPILTRAEVIGKGTALYSAGIPESHAPAADGQTSGSTGMPLRFRTTALTQLMWNAFNLRDHVWHRRDLGLKLATIRPDRGFRDGGGHTAPAWSAALAEACVTGPSSLLHSSNPIDRQIEWLAGEDPDYLLTLPSNLHELAREMHRRDVRLARLREARTFGEALRAETRAECGSLMGVKVVDLYTSQEAGYLALQCPDHDHYHVQSENVILEVLDPEDRPCAPGAIGKVVISTLHNFAMPLIRYEIGDYAEAGAACPCGRGLPVIRRVLGRERNLALAPDGGKYYPSFAAESWSHIAPIRQVQLVQTSPREITVNLVAARPLEPAEQESLVLALRRTLGHPYELSLAYRDQIRRSASGKYEDFICQVADGRS